MIVTIDGPAGAGKSSAARLLAQRLEFRFLDTGAMYRAVAWAALREGIDLKDDHALGQFVQDLKIELDPDAVRVNGRDVTREIRTPEVTQTVRFVADNLEVRARLSVLQRRVAEGGNIVTEGRDQGTVVFPDADCKIFLTATPGERARRRYSELLERGVATSLEEVLAQQEERDRHDEDRPVGGLQKADDAIEVLTDGLSPDDVLDRIERIVRECQAKE